MDKLNLVDQLISALSRVPVDGNPFCHVWIEEAFENATYDRLLAHLPESRYYEALRHHDALQPDGSSSRLRFRLEPKMIAPLPLEQRQFWSSVRDELCSPQMRKAFCAALRDGMDYRFGKNSGDIRLIPKPLLTRDLPGYRIGIHTDIFEKVITAQFYLPADNSQSHLGTRFYRLEEKSYCLAKQLQFQRNCGYAFSVTDQSFHGVEKLSAADGERNSLMLIYYLR